MDRKTLEYMEERAKKARCIVKKIDELLKYAERVDRVAEIGLRDRSNDGLFALSARYDESNHVRLINELKPVLHNLIANEISLLEQELAEL